MSVHLGDRVLVSGAGGGVGLVAVQLAGPTAPTSTGVDVAGKLDVVASLGAHEVIDATDTDFTRTGQRSDVIIDVPGNHPIADCRRALTAEGTYVLIGHDRCGHAGNRLVGASLSRSLRLLVRSPLVRQKLSPNVAGEPADPLGLLADLLAAGKLTPVVDRTLPLADADKAIAYLADGHAVGKVVLTV